MAKRKGLSTVIDTADLDQERVEKAVLTGTSHNLTKGYQKPATKNKLIHRADPKRCRPWEYADRDKLWFTPENCADLIHGFKTRGQDIPAKVRRVTDDPNFDFEVILGNRRRWTAEYTGKTLDVEITTANDSECFLLMDSENDDREDISPFERACSYKKVIDAGLFSSGRKLAEDRNVSKSVMADSLKAAEITDTSLMALFNDLRDISVSGAAKLMRLWGKSENEKGAILAKAHALKANSKMLAASKIIKSLIDSTKDNAPVLDSKDYSDESGAVRIKATEKKGVVTLKIDKNGLSKRDIKKLISQATADFI